MNIAISPVVEDHRDKVDVVPYSGRQLLDVEHESAVTVDRKDGCIWTCDLGTETGRVPPTERALVAGSDKAPRIVNRHSEAADIADLRELVDEDAILRQCISDSVDIRQLGREGSEHLHRLGAGFVQLVFPRGPFCVVFRQSVGQSGQDGGGITDDTDIRFVDPVHFFGGKIDTDHLQVTVRAPKLLVGLHTRADSEHDVDILPKAMTRWHGDR